MTSSRSCSTCRHHCHGERRDGPRRTAAVRKAHRLRAAAAAAAAQHMPAEAAAPRAPAVRAPVAVLAPVAAQARVGTPRGAVPSLRAAARVAEELHRIQKGQPPRFRLSVVRHVALRRSSTSCWGPRRPARTISTSRRCFGAPTCFQLTTPRPPRSSAPPQAAAAVAAVAGAMAAQAAVVATVAKGAAARSAAAGPANGLRARASGLLALVGVLKTTVAARSAAAARLVTIRQRHRNHDHDRTAQRKRDQWSSQSPLKDQRRAARQAPAAVLQAPARPA